MTCHYSAQTLKWPDIPFKEDVQCLRCLIFFFFFLLVFLGLHLSPHLEFRALLKSNFHWEDWGVLCPTNNLWDSCYLFEDNKTDKWEIKWFFSRSPLWNLQKILTQVFSPCTLGIPSQIIVVWTSLHSLTSPVSLVIHIWDHILLCIRIPCEKSPCSQREGPREEQPL